MKKITNKIILVSLITGVLVAFLIGTVSIYSLRDMANDNNEHLGETMYHSYDSKLNSEVDIALSICETNYKKAINDEISMEDAQKRSLDAIKNIRFGVDGYFWINDMQTPVPMMIMHPTTPSLDGTILVDPKYNVVSENKLNLFSECVRVCSENGNGYVDYIWPKPGSIEPQPKRSYVKLFKEWNWVIGTGNYVDDIEAELLVERDKSEAYTWNVVLIVIVFIFVSLGLAFLFSIIMGKRISKPIIDLVAIVTRVSAGNLANNINIDAKDEVGQLAKGINKMQSKLREVVTEIRQAAETLAAGSSEISISSQQIARGANQQAASSEEVSASMEEMASTISQNTDNAQKTEQIAVKASDNIDKAAVSAQQSLASVREISNKINIIGDIAEKTDLLAINAAVEAARAGKHGKGFAVVASEVRKLAEHTQKAAKEIVEFSKQSLIVTEEAGKLMAVAAPFIQENAYLVREISNASAEQNSGAEQVNVAIQNLSEITQQNSASAEELATSSEELASQAENLSSIISYFKIDDAEVNSVGQIFSMIEKHNNEISKLKGQLVEIDEEAEIKPSVIAPKHEYRKEIKYEGVNLNIDDDDNNEFENF